jgi:crotonobetainyl-CoA:carnitine CoA-transferase CaiB-like acyl-CoA transferase
VCEAFELTEFAADPALAGNNERVAQRDRILPRLRAVFAGLKSDELLRRLEAAGIPAANIARPEDLFDDPHLNAGGGLVQVNLADGRPARLPALPLELDEQRCGLRRDLGLPGADSREVLRDLGVSEAEFAELLRSGVVAEASAADRGAAGSDRSDSAKS